MLENLHLACIRHKKATGESQGKIAFQAGMVESRLSRIINERIQATPQECASLSKVLEVSEHILFSFEKIQL